jgi:hypothetical protein
MNDKRTDKQGAGIARRTTDDLLSGHIGAHIAGELIRRGVVERCTKAEADWKINRSGIFRSYYIRRTSRGA